MRTIGGLGANIVAKGRFPWEDPTNPVATVTVAEVNREALLQALRRMVSNVADVRKS